MIKVLHNSNINKVKGRQKKLYTVLANTPNTSLQST